MMLLLCKLSETIYALGLICGTYEFHLRNVPSCLFLAGTNGDISFRLGATALPYEMKALGATNYNKRTFTSLIKHIFSKASVKVNLIQTCFISKGVLTLIQAYVVYVRPLLEYAT